jgi:hypothetical protein
MLLVRPGKVVAAYRRSTHRAEGPREKDAVLRLRTTRASGRERERWPAPAIGHFRSAPFDRAAVTARLRELGASVIPSADEPESCGSPTTTTWWSWLDESGQLVN